MTYLRSRSSDSLKHSLHGSPRSLSTAPITSSIPIASYSNCSGSSLASFDGSLARFAMTSTSRARSVEHFVDHFLPCLNSVLFRLEPPPVPDRDRLVRIGKQSLDCIEQTAEHH